MNPAALGATERGSEPASDARPVAVVAAMAEEIAPLVGRLSAPSVILTRTGEGRQRAETGAEALLDRVRPRLLVVLGISGGLTPSLEPGALLVAREVREGTEPVPPPDPTWVERALTFDGTVAGTVISSPRILCTPHEKARARDGLPADEPAAVDLESATFARAAARRSIPYVVIRAISDTADETLPLDFNRCRDEAGGVRRLAVVRQALLHPASVRGLWRLRKRVDRCAHALAGLTLNLIHGGPR